MKPASNQKRTAHRHKRPSKRAFGSLGWAFIAACFVFTGCPEASEAAPERNRAEVLDSLPEFPAAECGSLDRPLGDTEVPFLGGRLAFRMPVDGEFAQPTPLLGSELLAPHTEWTSPTAPGLHVRSTELLALYDGQGIDAFAAYLGPEWALYSLREDHRALLAFTRAERQSPLLRLLTTTSDGFVQQTEFGHEDQGCMSALVRIAQSVRIGTRPLRQFPDRTLHHSGFEVRVPRGAYRYEGIHGVGVRFPAPIDAPRNGIHIGGSEYAPPPLGAGEDLVVTTVQSPVSGQEIEWTQTVRGNEVAREALFGALLIRGSLQSIDAIAAHLSRPSKPQPEASWQATLVPAPQALPNNASARHLAATQRLSLVADDVAQSHLRALIESHDLPAMRWLATHGASMTARVYGVAALWHAAPMEAEEAANALLEQGDEPLVVATPCGPRSRSLRSLVDAGELASEVQRHRTLSWQIYEATAGLPDLQRGGLAVLLANAPAPPSSLQMHRDEMRLQEVRSAPTSSADAPSVPRDCELREGILRCWRGRAKPTELPPSITNAHQVLFEGGRACALLEDQSRACWTIDDPSRSPFPEYMTQGLCLDPAPRLGLSVSHYNDGPWTKLLSLEPFCGLRGANELHCAGRDGDLPSGSEHSPWQPMIAMLLQRRRLPFPDDANVVDANVVDANRGTFFVASNVAGAVGGDPPVFWTTDGSVHVVDANHDHPVLWQTAGITDVRRWGNALLVLREDGRVFRLASPNASPLWQGLPCRNATDGARFAEASPEELHELQGTRTLTTQGEVGCALLHSGAVRCFGAIHAFGSQWLVPESNLTGSTAFDSRVPDPRVLVGPTTVPQLHGAQRLHVHRHAVCGEMPTGTLRCVGRFAAEHTGTAAWNGVSECEPGTPEP